MDHLVSVVASRGKADDDPRFSFLLFNLIIIKIWNLPFVLVCVSSSPWSWSWRWWRVLACRVVAGNNEKALTMVGHETRRTVTRLTFENHTSCEWLVFTILSSNVVSLSHTNWTAWWWYSNNNYAISVGRNADLMPRTEPDRPSAPSPLPHHHRHHIIKESSPSRRRQQQQQQQTPRPIKRLLRQHKIRRPTAVSKCV